MKKVLEIENVSKQYRLGLVGSGSLRDDFKKWSHRLRGKEDPTLMLGEVNNRTIKAEDKYVWALRDINFTVNEGDVLGIIGRNGAGKSTLLKLLSKVTSPTTGHIRINGRIASLLEVGTGFHPELTGRENIYLNGAILGMRKHEITQKLEEIIAFAGVEKYADTPVKRYSSGMYVRLAFAVAAHLEPEILIVDEVLAVGDIEFQKKCLGKMKDVSEQGRTILFVSHNITAIRNLCRTGILLDHGKMLGEQQKIDKIIDKYQSQVNSNINQKDLIFPIENEFIRVEQIEINRNRPQSFLTINSEFEVCIQFYLKEQMTLNLSMNFNSHENECIFAVTTELPAKELKPGLYQAKCFVPSNLLNDVSYYLGFMFVKNESQPILIIDNGYQIELFEDRSKSSWHGKYPGLIRPKLEFNIHSYE